MKIIFSILLFVGIHSFGQNFNVVEKNIHPFAKEDDKLGTSTSIYQNWIAAGAPYDGVIDSLGSIVPQSGSVYLYELDSQDSAQNIQEIRPYTSFANDQFGSVVLMLDSFLFVSALLHDRDVNDDFFVSGAGAVFIYKRNTNNSWTQVQKIVAQYRSLLDFFGFSLAAYGNTLAVGVPNHDKNQMGTDPINNSGVVYLFERNSQGLYVQSQIITANIRIENGKFGSSLAMFGNTLVVGASGNSTDQNNQNLLVDAGAAYVFQKNPSGTWGFIQKLIPNERYANVKFGYCSALSASNLLIGAPYEYKGLIQSDSLFEAGAAYHFYQSSNGTFEFREKVLAFDRHANARFGQSLSISGSFTLIGCPGNSYSPVGGQGLSQSGGLYSYISTGNNLNYSGKVVSSDIGLSDWFGHTVSISGNRAVTSSPNDRRFNTTDSIYENRLGAIYTLALNPPSGLTDFETHAYSVYPNPFRNRILIECDKNLAEGIVVMVRNMQGAIVHSESLPSGIGPYSINVEDWPAGFYVLELISKTGNHCFKLIKP